MRTHRFLLTALLVLPVMSALAGGVTTLKQTVAAAGRQYTVTGVVVDLHDSTVSMKVGLAWGYVGRTEWLEGIAKRYGAIAAINGSFFDAYSNATLRNPDMPLMTNGQWVFKSNLGAVLGFTENNMPLIGLPRHRLQGLLTDGYGKKQEWFAYWLNRRPTSSPCVTLFTSAWGKTVQPMGGSCVVVKDGLVKDITSSAVDIPDNGYVLHFLGERTLRDRFKVGKTAQFTPEVTDTAENAGDWERVREAVGAGPRVLVHGVPVFNPKAEGFSDPKILQRAGMRSAAGVTPDGKLYLITVPGARVSELGHILKAVGCSDGMNLDGGASSGLWLRGSYLTKPGRPISNALLIIPR